jgi:hypothetical protein
MPLSDLHRPRRSWVACARGLTHTPTRSSLWLRCFSASRLLGFWLIGKSFYSIASS